MLPGRGDDFQPTKVIRTSQEKPTLPQRYTAMLGTVQGAGFAFAQLNAIICNGNLQLGFL